ncbi:MAG TPA: GNAT family N-acetyltransferase, partial [candidate division Zixibacteria bacterium]|nr:GNAT family N-acetyltransferase [candidate division Zixibacteria bacterium]
MWRVYSSQSLPVDRWRAVAGAHLTLAPEFLEIWRATGATPLYFLTDPAADTPQCGFTALRFGARPFGRTQALVDGLPAALAGQGAAESSASRAFSAALDALARASGLRATWVDYDLLSQRFAPPPSWKQQIVTTQVIQEPAERLRFNKRVERHIASAKERGAFVRPIGDRTEVSACVALMRQTFKRHGRARAYPAAFYDRLYNLARQDSRVIWLVCLIDNTIIGSHIALRIDNEILSWQPYVDRERREYKPAYLLYDALIRHAGADGADAVNLGGS